MKPPPDENQIVRFLDGEMDASEKAAFEAMLAENAELRTEIESFGQLGSLLRQHVPAERVELVAAGPGDEPLLSAAIDRLRVRVHGLSDQPRIQNDDYSLQT